MIRTHKKKIRKGECVFCVSFGKLFDVDRQTGKPVVCWYASITFIRTCYSIELMCPRKINYES